ncbi:MAG: hypothetical protein J0I63_05590, partial [Thiobacillus sp.]|nr:hypothetical protein [Thiobacillus sp.]
MPSSSDEHPHHAVHQPSPTGSHVMPDGTVMAGHAHHSGHLAHPPTAAKPVPRGDPSQVEYT